MQSHKIGYPNVNKLNIITERNMMMRSGDTVGASFGGVTDQSLAAQFSFYVVYCSLLCDICMERSGCMAYKKNLIYPVFVYRLALEQKFVQVTWLIDGNKPGWLLQLREEVLLANKSDNVEQIVPVSLCLSRKAQKWKTKVVTESIFHDKTLVTTSEKAE